MTHKLKCVRIPCQYKSSDLEKMEKNKENDKNNPTSSDKDFDKK